MNHIMPFCAIGNYMYVYEISRLYLYNMHIYVCVCMYGCVYLCVCVCVFNLKLVSVVGPIFQFHFKSFSHCRMSSNKNFFQPISRLIEKNLETIRLTIVVLVTIVVVLSQV